MAKIKASLIKDLAAHNARMRGETVSRKDCYYTCASCEFAQPPRETSVTVQRGRKGRIYCRILNGIRKENSIGCLHFKHKQTDEPN